MPGLLLWPCPRPHCNPAGRFGSLNTVVVGAKRDGQGGGAAEAAPLAAMRGECDAACWALALGRRDCRGRLARGSPRIIPHCRLLPSPPNADDGASSELASASAASLGALAEMEAEGGSSGAASRASSRAASPPPLASLSMEEPPAADSAAGAAAAAAAFSLGQRLPQLLGPDYCIEAVLPGETIGQVRVCCRLLRGGAKACPLPAHLTLLPSNRSAPQVLSRANHSAADMLASVGAAAAAAVAAGDMPPEVADRLMGTYSARMGGYT